MGDITAGRNINQNIDIVAAYSQYTKEVQNEITTCTQNFGGMMLEEIASGYPNIGGGAKKGWVKTVKKNSAGVRIIVHNKAYQLVHLQELPHNTGAEGKNRGDYPKGGQNDVIGTVRAANKKYSDKLNDEIQRILEK